ncbi:MAG: glycoside hydrolase family 36 protein [Devosia sp.]
MTTPFAFDRETLTLAGAHLLIEGLVPLLDGAVFSTEPPSVAGTDLLWQRSDGMRFVLTITNEPARTRLDMRVEGFAGTLAPSAIGLRLSRIDNVQRYLRNGYMSWDGSYFVEPDAVRSLAPPDPTLLEAYAMTALVPRGQAQSAVLGFLRHDRFQSRLRFSFADGPLGLDIETLIDGVPHEGNVAAEPLVLFAGGADIEETLRDWARQVAGAAPLTPRLPSRRLTGWCSWYNLYASLSEPVLREHLAAARRFRDETNTPFDIFLIDDGFTPEMGDWLDFKPGLEGLPQLLSDIAAEGFTPGLWTAPFMVGNRSKLYRDHPDWVVKNRATGAPLAPMTFYGEFRWHKRSEEYYVLDVTHPKAEAYIRSVFRIWAKDWGCAYFKTDFMHLGAMYGPDTARWHRDGLSRIEIWMTMARLIREEIGESQWLLCGSPLWAPVGLCDALRIGRDIGVSWHGHYSAESLLRDQASRNFANGILWQADPDCILLRDRFHQLTDAQVHSLARYAGLSGGVLMTSDQLDEVPSARRALLAELAGDGAPFACDFPELGRASLRYKPGHAPDGSPRAIAEGDPVLVQRIRGKDGSVRINLFNTSDRPTTRLLSHDTTGLVGHLVAICDGEGPDPVAVAEGWHIQLLPYQSRLVTVTVR